MTFNVLYDPWIPVIYKTKKLETIGLKKLFSDASAIKEISCPSSLETYSVHRFIIAFLMDAYELNRPKDRKRLFDSHKFDMNIIDNYINVCIKEGTSFDLFDTQHPFMQSPLDERYDGNKKLSSVAELFPDVPSGTNHIHFNHTLNSQISRTPAECIRAILAIQTFTPMGGKGYSTSINGTPCYYALIQGNNLFETLVLGMMSKSETSSMTWDSPPVAWRDFNAVIPGSVYADVSVLSGLTWQPRRITLIPSDDGTVKKIHFNAGRKFAHNDRWQDPHATLVFDKNKGLLPLCPRIGKAPWRDLAAFSVSKNNKHTIPPLIITQAINCLEYNNIADLQLYGVVTKQAKYVNIATDSIGVPLDVLTNEEKAERLRVDIDFINDIAKEMTSSVKSMTNAPHSNGKGKTSYFAANTAQQMFLSEIRHFIFSNYMNYLSSVDCSVRSWENPLINMINKKGKLTALKIIENTANTFGYKSKDFIRQAVVIKNFNTKIDSLIKKRK